MAMVLGWLPSMVGLPDEALPVLLACGVLLATLVGWALHEPRVPPKPRKSGVLDEHNVLWRSDSVGTFVSVPEEGVTHVYACLERTAARYPEKRGIGQRPLLKREMVPDPANPSKKFEKLTLGEYEWLTFGAYHCRVCDFAAGLVAFAGLAPGSKLVVYGETQRDWMVAALAAFRQDVSVVTIYATLGEDGVVHGISQTKASAVVADAKLLPVLLACAPRCKTLKHVITLSPTMDAADRQKLEGLGVRVTSMAALIEAGRAAPLPPARVSPESIAVVMYTSGTTGMPKGVLISHRNIMAAMSGMKQALGGFTKPSDVFLAYLPLAHIMEMAAELCLMFFGSAIGYGSPHTLTSTGVKLAAGQVGDAPLLRPTVMVFAPAVLDKVYKGVQTKVAKASPLARRLFDAALASGLANYEAGGIGASPLLNALVFKKIQALLGGKVRAMITGSAPLAPDVQKFVATVFNCPVRQGYGLTETCAASVLAHLGDNATSTVGPPAACACVRLRDWPEGGYLFADREKAEVGMPRGEVLIGGPMVTPGYLVDPEAPDAEVEEKNRTEYVSIGGIRYFCSGDVGQITPDGCLQIIDRKKDLVKLQQGEYVALSKVENALKGSPYVELPMVYALSSKDYCVALVCPAHAALRELAQAQGLPADDLAALCEHPKIVAAVSKSCAEACKAARLAPFEVPKKLGLVADGWTPENDMLTAAMKLKRNQIVARHKAQLDALYK